MGHCRFAGVAVAAASLLGCWAVPARHVGSEPGARACHYELTVVDPGAAELAVDARCEGEGVRAFVASERVMAHLVGDARAADGTPLGRHDARFVLPAERPAHIRYRVPLGAVAELAGDIDVAARVGRSWIAPVSTWALSPEPVAMNADITIGVRVPAGFGFATGMHRRGDGYAIRGYEIRIGTYAVFGRFERQRLTVPGPLSLDGQPYRDAELEIVTLDGRVEASPELRLRWVRDAALGVTEFFHGFPVERALLVVVPAAGYRGVVHGKVVAAGGATIALRLGEHATEERLYRDWILVHELFHLGFPSFWGEGKWLDEGLATYFEPIIRARAGWRGERAVWNEFAHEMHQGLRAVERTGLERTDGDRGIYWGGALVALLADARARRESGGRRGLEDGVRALLAAGGDATRIWRLDDAIAVIDRALGAPVLRELADAHSYTGRPVDLPELFRSLGVRARDDGVELRDDAPLLSVRRAIVFPPGVARVAGASSLAEQSRASAASRSRGKSSDPTRAEHH
jgi:hypothetical protein